MADVTVGEQHEGDDMVAIRPVAMTEPGDAGQARSRVLIADDHPIYRDGLARVLTECDAFEVVADVGDGVEALEGIRRLDPDLAVVDLRLPGLDGIAVIESARREGLLTRIVIVSAYEDSGTVISAFSAGAWAYLTKLIPPEDICATLSRVARGDSVIPEEIRARLLTDRSERRGREATTVLSAREREVLKLTAEGMSAPEIAEQLFVGVTTVKTHLQHIYEKFNVSDRAAAVTVAHRRGLLDL